MEFDKIKTVHDALKYVTEHSNDYYCMKIARCLMFIDNEGKDRL